MSDNILTTYPPLPKSGVCVTHVFLGPTRGTILGPAFDETGLSIDEVNTATGFIRNIDGTSPASATLGFMFLDEDFDPLADVSVKSQQYNPTTGELIVVFEYNTILQEPVFANIFLSEDTTIDSECEIVPLIKSSNIRGDLPV